MKYLSDCLSREQVKELRAKGYYVYQIRFNLDWHNTIEKNVFVNNMGEIITKEEIDFKNKDYVLYNAFCKKNKSVGSIEEL